MSNTITSRKRHATTVLGHGATPFVFGHGFGCDQTMWKDVAPKLVQENSRAILYDLMGFGLSDRTYYSQENYSSLAAHAADLLAITDCESANGIHFVGHSLSATIGVLAANMRPKAFKSLTLVAPSPRYINDGDYKGGFELDTMIDLLAMLDNNYLGWSRSFAPLAMGNPDQPQHTRRLEESFCKTDPAIAKHLAKLTFLGDARKEYAAIDIPCLILQSSEDAIAPASVGEYLSENMKKARLVQLAATGHCPHVTAPDAVADEIRQFTSFET